MSTHVSERSTRRPPEHTTRQAVAGATSAPSSPVSADRCSVVAALGALGDSWSFIVLRELFYGVRRFNEIQADLGISRSVLTDRLGRLVDLGVVRTVPYQEPGDRVRSEYRLTRKGVALLPTIVALKEWGDEYVYGGEPTVTIYERATGDDVRLEFRSASGQVVQPHEMAPRLP